MGRDDDPDRSARVVARRSEDPNLDGALAGVEGCHCGCSLKPPVNGEWWWPHTDPEPDQDVRAVVRFGDHPYMRRIIRTKSGWIERHGNMQPLPWREVGLCSVGNCHPVVRAKVL